MLLFNKFLTTFQFSNFIFCSYKMSTKKFVPNKLYKIIDVKEIETKYGKSYILTDDKYDEYFATTKISKFINDNNITNNNGNVVMKIKTNNYRTFNSEDGDEIKFLDLRCFKN